MNINEITPFIRRSFILEKSPYNKTVINGDSRLFYVLEGNGELTVDGKTYNVSKDSLGLWKSGTKYKWDFSKSKKTSLVIINFDYSEKYKKINKPIELLTEKSFKNTDILETEKFDDNNTLNEPVFLNNMFVFKKDVTDIVDEINTNRLYCENISCAMLKLLILKIVRYYESSAHSNNLKIEPILEFIHSNYQRDISNKEISEMINYHPHYVNLLMKKYMGTTLHSYINDYRLSESLKLIINTELSVEEIAEKTGFSNPSHFCTSFKKKFGISPSAQRKTVKMI